jgi:hypothetical protein
MRAAAAASWPCASAEGTGIMGESFISRLQPKERTLAALAAVTLIVLIAAGLALWREADRLGPVMEPRPAFPNLAARIDRADRLVLEHQGERLVVERSDRGEWVLPDRGGYAARLEPLRKTLVGLTRIELVERKTARADWHDQLGLVAPDEGGDAMQVTLFDGDGNTLAALLLGKRPHEVGDVAGASPIFVRRPGENQTWLARGALALEISSTHWLERRPFDIDEERIRAVRLTPPAETPYTLERGAPAQADFVLQTLPEGRVRHDDPGRANNVAKAIAGLEIDDVRREDAAPFSPDAAVVIETFDGLSLTLDIQREGHDYWARARASYEHSPEAETRAAMAVAQEVADINARTTGWVFRLPRFKGVQLTSPIENLLMPDDGGETGLKTRDGLEDLSLPGAQDPARIDLGTLPGLGERDIDAKERPADPEIEDLINRPDAE